MEGIVCPGIAGTQRIGVCSSLHKSTKSRAVRRTVSGGKRRLGADRGGMSAEYVPLAGL